MKSHKLLILTTALLCTVMFSGCASQSQIQSLQADVDELRKMSEKASNDANLALQDTVLIKKDLTALRQISESTNTDSAATRKLIEQMNARLENGSGTSTFK